MTTSTHSAEAIVALTNVLGLHARAVFRLVNLAEEFSDTTILISSGKKEADAKSTANLILLEAVCGDRLKISATGKSAEAAVSALKTLIVTERLRETKLAVSFLSPETIATSLRGTTPEDVLHELLEILKDVHRISDNCIERLYFKARERERLQGGITAIRGVAYSHADDVECPRLVAALGILPKAADWRAEDPLPVRMVCVAVGPDDKSYQWPLVDISNILASQSIREKILLSNNGKEIYGILSTEANRLNGLTENPS